MKRAFLIVAFAASISGCASVSPFAGLSSPPQEPRKMADYAQTEKQTPLKVGVTPDGKDVIAYATERTYTASSKETPAQLSWIQKLGRWIGGLSLLAVVFIVVSLAVFGGAPIVWLVRKYRAMKAALTNTVQAIENMPPDAYEKLKPELKASQNEEDKTLIKKIKVELPPS